MKGHLKARWRCPECGGITMQEVEPTGEEGHRTVRLERPLCIPCAEKALAETETMP